jgi:trehalose 6-phosphate synthase/phosphatase
VIGLGGAESSGVTDALETWTPHQLTEVWKRWLPRQPLIVVSNRQPYAHNRLEDGRLEIQLPNGGLVSAVEPIIKSCSGIWIAHGSGAADRATVDCHDRVAVPPEHPEYILRRLWLTSEEEQGYYTGFANEGLWPLCHRTPVRPRFRRRQWGIYSRVNRKFADAVAEESSCASPIVLIQDYHLALLPLLVRTRLPRATIVLFWHAPWPPVEQFLKCPWGLEILVHMLGANLLGFQTEEHRQNFLDAVGCLLNGVAEREGRAAVALDKHYVRTGVYPASIEYPPPVLSSVPPAGQARADIYKQYSIGRNTRLALAVDRWDFTKGILQRLLALEATFDRDPQWRGGLTLLQVAAPSRSGLPAYRSLQMRTASEVARINGRFATRTWTPIILVSEQQRKEQVFKLYRAADLCLVSSLHDGMNLVAKEFVAARDDEDGVLLLSTFAGASHELVHALPINPCDVPGTAKAIEGALRMPRQERRARMRQLRLIIERNNVYRWAGRMLMDAAKAGLYAQTNAGRPSRRIQ